MSDEGTEGNTEDNGGIPYVKMPDLDPKVSQWFLENIGRPTRMQTDVWSKTITGSNVLVVSPTGSGKTLAAVIPAVDGIVRGRYDRSRTSILYISPMKALGTDLVKNLTSLSDGLGRISGRKEKKWGRGRRKKGEVLKDAHIQIGIRTGDVPQTQRRRMRIDPPDLLVVTPENLLLMLCSKARDTLSSVRFVIVDEVHEMVNSARGALLSLSLEYLEDIIKSEGLEAPQRLGLSATVNPISIASRYLGGMKGTGKLRPVEIIEEKRTKVMKIEVKTIFSELDGGEGTEDKTLKEVGTLLDESSGSVVVFHNTRRKAEQMAYSLYQNGYKGVLPHHGSLGADLRKQAEEGLKIGELDGIVSSTSLELGIDIGGVETVCQVSSPKDPGRLIQRFGRSGHGLDRSSHGILLPINGLDLIESLATAKAAVKWKLRKVSAPKGRLDVLAQFMIGLSLSDKGTSLDDIHSISSRAYPYRRLRKKDVKAILRMLSERLPSVTYTSPRLWFDKKNGRYRPRSNTKQAFYLNCGTIPKEVKIKVLLEKGRKPIGDLSRDFGERLYEGDVILLGSRPYRITGFKGSSILVRAEPDSQPTVPSWTGEANPRPMVTSRELVRILNKGCSIGTGDGEGSRLVVDNSSVNLCERMREHLKERGILPLEKRIPVEVIRVTRGRKVLIFHIPLGRSVNEPLGRGVAYSIRKRIGARVDHISTDNGFAVKTPSGTVPEDLFSQLSKGEFERISSELALRSGSFRTGFSHSLGRALLVLGRFRGRDTSPVYRRTRLEGLLGSVTNSYYSAGWENEKGPQKGLVMLADEALKEVLEEKTRVSHAQRLIDDVSSGDIKLEMLETQAGISIPGSEIIGSWSRGVTDDTAPETELQDEMGQPPPGDTGSPPKNINGASSIREKIVSFLRGKNTNTKRNALLSAGEEMTIPEESGDGSHDGYEAAIIDSDGRTAILPLGEETEDLTPWLNSIKVSRIRRDYLDRSSNLKKILKRTPFFTHPLEIINRSGGIGYLELRSAIKGRRVIAYSAAGNSRIGDPEWSKVFTVLSPSVRDIPKGIRSILRPGCRIERSQIRKALGKAGEELTEIIEDLKSANILVEYPRDTVDLLGAPPGMIVTEVPREIKDNLDLQGELIKEFLHRMGPFDLNELSLIFGWQKGGPPQGVIRAIENGELAVGYAAPGPISTLGRKKGGPGSIWLWKGGPEELERIDKKRNWIERIIPSDNIEILTSSDPKLVLSGRWSRGTDIDRFRGGRLVHLIALGSGREMAGIDVLETGDLIRVLDLDCVDFKALPDVCGESEVFLRSYEELGFDLFLIEKIMDIPAGEASEKAVERFMSRGYLVTPSPRGSMLYRGEAKVKVVPRKLIIREMLFRQGLCVGSRKKHPLEVLLLLGGVIDRWEILSRIGAARYSKLSVSDIQPVEDLRKEYWSKLLEGCSTGEVPTLPDMDMLIGSATERLSEIGDLTKRFSLRKGKADQPGLVWALEGDLLCYPRPSSKASSELKTGDLRLISNTRKSRTEEAMTYIKEHGLSKKVQSLLQKGFLIEDPWGSVHAPFDDGRYEQKRTYRKGRTIRGLQQRAWLMRCANALGAFTFEDMREYSPEITDPSKLRWILRDLIGNGIKRLISFEPHPRAQYHIEGIDILEPETCDQREGNGIGIISPKDRMSRVISVDLPPWTTRGSGFTVLKDGRPVGLISMKKMKKAIKHTGFGGPSRMSGGMESYLIKKAWFDLRLKKGELLRDVKKAFFEMGCQVFTKPEKTRIESLYRDVEKTEREVQ